MFSSPLWLAALVALAIPLALHLWSRRPRQVIRVGSIRHLEHLPPPRSRSARLDEPLLLVLRLAILTALALGLAGLRWPGAALGRPDRLVLVEPSLLGDALLDSLNRAGAVVRLIAPGLPEVRLPRPAADTASLPLWDALRAADGIVAPDGALEVYARPRLATLGDERPTLRAMVRWHAPAPAAAGRRLAGLTRLPDDSLQAILAVGDAGGVDYARVRVTSASALPIPAPGAPAPPPPPRRLTVLPSDRALTPRLSAAIRAVSSELGQDASLAADSQRGDAVLSLPPRLLESDALADTLLDRWPWRFSDPGDPREVSLAAARPRAASPFSREATEPHGRELLILAALLLLVERWLASRPRRGAG